MVKSQDSINILWDGVKDVIIKVPVQYQYTPQSTDHKLMGLCGLYDGNSTNDFTDIQENEIQSPTQEQINAFADSYKQNPSCNNVIDQKKKCYEPNGNSEKGIMFAEKVCSALEAPVFQPCHQFVDPKPFIEMCMYDVCTTNYTKYPNTFCDALSLYARVCAWYHNTTLMWRQQFCRKYTYDLKQMLIKQPSHDKLLANLSWQTEVCICE